MAQRHFFLDPFGEFGVPKVPVCGATSTATWHAKTVTLPTWWHISLSKWVITPVISGLTDINRHYLSHLQLGLLLVTYNTLTGISHRWFQTTSKRDDDVQRLLWKTRADLGLSENRVYSQWNSHLIGIRIINHWVQWGTLFSDTPKWKQVTKPCSRSWQTRADLISWSSSRKRSFPSQDEDFPSQMLRDCLQICLLRLQTFIFSATLTLDPRAQRLHLGLSTVNGTDWRLLAGKFRRMNPGGEDGANKAGRCYCTPHAGRKSSQSATSCASPPLADDWYLRKMPSSVELLGGLHDSVPVLHFSIILPVFY